MLSCRKHCFLNVVLLLFISFLFLSSCQDFGEEGRVGEDITFPEEPVPSFKKKTLGDYDSEELLSKGGKESKKYNNLIGERKYGKLEIDKTFICQNCILNEEYVFFLFLLKNGEYSIEYGTVDDLVATITKEAETNKVMIYSRGHYQKGESAEGNPIITLSSFFIPSVVAYYRNEKVGYSGLFYADITGGPLLIKDWSVLEEKAAVYEVLRLEKKGKFWIEANSKSKFILNKLF